MDLIAKRITIQVLRDILKEVQSSMVPRTIVREWACATFQSATDYWTFRKVKRSMEQNIDVVRSRLLDDILDI